MEYTAIYDTKALKGIYFSFRASDDAEAVSYCKRKFNAKRVKLIEDTGKPSGCGRLVGIIKQDEY